MEKRLPQDRPKVGLPRCVTEQDLNEERLWLCGQVSRGKQGRETEVRQHRLALRLGRCSFLLGPNGVRSSDLKTGSNVPASRLPEADVGLNLILSERMVLIRSSSVRKAVLIAQGDTEDGWLGCVGFSKSRWCVYAALFRGLYYKSLAERDRKSAAGDFVRDARRSQGGNRESKTSDLLILPAQKKTSQMNNNNKNCRRYASAKCLSQALTPCLSR